MSITTNYSSSALNTGTFHGTLSPPSAKNVDKTTTEPSDPLNFLLDTGPHGAEKFVAIIAEYIGEISDVKSMQLCSKVFNTYFKEEKFPTFNPEYRESLVKKLRAANEDITLLDPIEQMQLQYAQSLLPSINFSDFDCEMSEKLSAERFIKRYSDLFSFLPNITSLDISFNQRHTFNVPIVPLPLQLLEPVAQKLKVLQLDTAQQQTNEDIQTALDRFPVIERLKLRCHYNPLNLKFPTTLRALSFTDCFDLNDKSFNKMLEENPQLEELNFINSKVTLILNFPPRLKKLHIEPSAYVFVIPTELPSSLEELHLIGTEISLTNFPPNLKKLHCSSSALAKLDTISRSAVTKLEELDTEIQAIEKFEELPLLKKLVIKEDYTALLVTTSVEAVLKKAKNLEELEINRSNGIFLGPLHLPSTLKKFTIYLAGSIQELFEKLPDNLEEITVCGASITRLPPLPPTMKEVHLYRCNQFSDFNSIIQPTSAIEALSIPNALSFIPPLPRLLKKLDLHNSKNLTTVESIQNITQAEYLEELDLSYSPIPSLCRLPPSIKKLNLRGCNHLSNKGLSSLQNAPKLQQLNLAETNITELNFEFPKSLIEVYLPREHFDSKKSNLMKKYPTVEFIIT